MPFQTRTCVLAHCGHCGEHLTHDDADTPIAYASETEAAGAFARHAARMRHPVAGLQLEPRRLHRPVCTVCGRSDSDDVEFIDQWWENTAAAVDYLREFGWAMSNGQLVCGRAHQDVPVG